MPDSPAARPEPFGGPHDSPRPRGQRRAGHATRQHPRPLLTVRPHLLDDGTPAVVVAATCDASAVLGLECDDAIALGERLRDLVDDGEAGTATSPSGVRPTSGSRSRGSPSGWPTASRCSGPARRTSSMTTPPACSPPPSFWVPAGPGPRPRTTWTPDRPADALAPVRPPPGGPVKTRTARPTRLGAAVRLSPGQLALPVPGRTLPGAAGTFFADRQG